MGIEEGLSGSRKNHFFYCGLTMQHFYFMFFILFKVCLSVAWSHHRTRFLNFVMFSLNTILMMHCTRIDFQIMEMFFGFSLQGKITSMGDR